jgi:hypothetical protein
VEQLIWHTFWLLLHMRTAREFHQEIVKSPSFVFGQTADEQVKWQLPVGYSGFSVPA